MHLEQLINIEPCQLSDEVLQNFKSSSDDEWIINDNTLKLLNNDPQQLLQCTVAGDRVVFTLSGHNKFRRSMIISHELELISKSPSTKQTVDDSNEMGSFTCPNSGPFLIVNASIFEASGFYISNCMEVSNQAIVMILLSALAILNDVRVTNNKNRTFVLQPNARLTIRNSYFENNNAHRGAGSVILATEHGHITLFNSSFHGSTATLGGAIFCLNYNNITIENSTVSGCEAYFGGGLYLNSTNHMVIVNSTFTRNIAAVSGGGLFSNFTNTITIIDSKLAGNYAELGGAIYLREDCKISILDSQLYENRATNGAVIFANRNISISITQTNFLKNNASIGGCIYGDRSFLTVQECKCIENTSSQQGGCFYLEACSANFKTAILFLNEAKGGGGGIYATSRTFLEIETANFSSNSGSTGGGMALVDDSTFFCRFCTFEGNSAIEGGGLCIESNARQIMAVQLTKSTFRSNNALNYGGGILVKTFGIRPLNCTDIKALCDRILLFGVNFKNNVGAFGSKIMATAPDNILIGCDRSYSDAQSLMTREKIELALGKRKLEIIDPKNMCGPTVSRRLSSNTNEIAIGTFGHILSITILSLHGSTLRSISNVIFELEVIRNAKEFPKILFHAQDAFGNDHAPLLFENEVLELSSPNRCIQKSFVFFTKNLNGTIPLIFQDVSMLKCEIDIASKEEDILQSATLIVQSDECGINEDLTKDKKSCHTCREGLYNFQPKEIEGCKTCPEGAQCNGTYIVPNDGYWHKSPCHSKVKQCIVKDACRRANRIQHITSFSENSIGCDLNQTRMEEYNEILCQEGYRGSLCGSCKESYGLTSSLECEKCKHIMFSILNLLAVTLYLLLSSSFTIINVLSLDSYENFLKYNLASYHGRATIEAENNALPLIAPEEQPSYSNILEEQPSNSNASEIQESNSSELEIQRMISSEPSYERNDLVRTKHVALEGWKILINFFQMTSIAAMMEIEWTQTLLKLYQGLQFISAATLNAVSSPLDCILSFTSDDIRAIRRVLFSLLVPTIVAAIQAVYWGWRHMVYRKYEKYFFTKRIILTISTVLYITYFDLTQIAVRIFDCVVVHDDNDFHSNSITQRWVGDTSVECYKSKHLVLVGIALVLLILVSIGYPLGCSYALYTRQTEVHRRRSWAHETISFLCGPYKDKFIYWECITMLKKAFLSIIIVFSYSLRTHAQGLLIVLVFVIFLYVYLVCRPYKEEYNTLNYYETSSLLASCLTYILIQFLNVEIYSELFKGFISASLIIINVGFTCIMLHQIITHSSSLLRTLLKYEGIGDFEYENYFRLLIIYLKTRRLHPSTS
eukprot:g3808.t1